MQLKDAIVEDLLPDDSPEKSDKLSAPNYGTKRWPVSKKVVELDPQDELPKDGSQISSKSGNTGISPEFGKFVDKAAKAYVDKLLQPSPLYESLIKKDKLNKISGGAKIAFPIWNSQQENCEDLAKNYDIQVTKTAMFPYTSTTTLASDEPASDSCSTESILIQPTLPGYEKATIDGVDVSKLKSSK